MIKASKHVTSVTPCDPDGEKNKHNQKSNRKSVAKVNIIHGNDSSP